MTSNLNDNNDNNQHEPIRTGLNDYSVDACGLAATVYCWSRSTPGSDRWIQAEKLGHELAKIGCGVVNGGYSGSMTAVSKGARLCAEYRNNAAHREAYPPSPLMPLGKVSSGDIIKRIDTESYNKDEIDGEPVAKDISVRGILVPGQFPDRVSNGNIYLTEAVDSRSMLHRLDLLSSLTRYYVILPGTLGTLTELVIIWQNSVLHPKGKDRPVILAFREPWEKLVKFACEHLEIQKDFEEAIQFVDTPEEAAAKILADFNEQKRKIKK